VCAASSLLQESVYVVANGTASSARSTEEAARKTETVTYNSQGQLQQSVFSCAALPKCVVRD
jgi:hypothetical protein